MCTTIRAMLTGLVIVSTGLTGCAKKPVLELNLAEKTLQSATAVDAKRYAQYEFEMARTMFDAGTDELKKQDAVFIVARDYAKARELLGKAVDQASAAKNAALAARQRKDTVAIRDTTAR